MGKEKHSMMPVYKLWMIILVRRWLNLPTSTEHHRAKVLSACEEMNLDPEVRSSGRVDGKQSTAYPCATPGQYSPLGCGFKAPCILSTYNNKKEA